MMDKGKQTMEAAYVVIGGGIAGVTCTETLSNLCPDEHVILLSASPLVKAVTNFKKVGHTLETFDVVEKDFASLQGVSINTEVVQATVDWVDPQSHELKASNGNIYKYKKLCICCGGQPKVVSKDNPHVLGIRDTESVATFQQRLKNARRIMIVGNGGIATELVHEIENCEVIWAIKDGHINHTFLDAGASQFLMPKLSAEKTSSEMITKRMKYTVSGSTDSKLTTSKDMGSALGPDWATNLQMKGYGDLSHKVLLESKVQVKRVMSPAEYSGSDCEVVATNCFGSSQTEWPVYVELTNNKVYGCDFVVSATGVDPCSNIVLKSCEFETSNDGGITVNDKMCTSVNDIYAAGDVCTAGWEVAPQWFQMRLWNQARQMGAYAAKSMVADSHGEEIHMDFCFELFTHVTTFFGYKVVLLGRFNGQGLENNYEILLRVTPGEEYVKVVMKDGKMQGAILIGETDLEETFENLILNDLDISVYGEDLLDPNIDIEDYFD